MLVEDNGAPTKRLHHKMNFALTSFTVTRKPTYDKNITFSITVFVYHRSVVKQDHYMTHFSAYANIVL